MDTILAAGIPRTQAPAGFQARLQKRLGSESLSPLVELAPDLLNLAGVALLAALSLIQAGWWRIGGIAAVVLLAVVLLLGRTQVEEWND